MFEFTLRGHSADPHNKQIKAIFDQTVFALRKEIDQSGSIGGEGYSTDPSGTLEFDSTQSVPEGPDQVATAKLVQAQADAELARALQAKAEADQAVADALAASGAPTTDELDTTADNVNASDAAVSLANDNGIDLATVKGTGTDGKIIVADVKAAIAAKSPA